MYHEHIQHHEAPRAVFMTVTVDTVKGEMTIVSKTEAGVREGPRKASARKEGTGKRKNRNKPMKMTSHLTSKVLYCRILSLPTKCHMSQSPQT